MRDSESLKKELRILSSKYITLRCIMEKGDYVFALEYAMSSQLQCGMCDYFYEKFYMNVRDYCAELFNTFGFLGGCSVPRAIYEENTKPIQARLDWINNITEAQFNIILDLYKK